jgi:hypothetical protein
MPPPSPDCAGKAGARTGVIQMAGALAADLRKPLEPRIDVLLGLGALTLLGGVYYTPLWVVDVFYRDVSA